MSNTNTQTRPVIGDRQTLYCTAPVHKGKSGFVSRQLSSKRIGRYEYEVREMSSASVTSLIDLSKLLRTTRKCRGGVEQEFGKAETFCCGSAPHGVYPS